MASVRGRVSIMRAGLIAAVALSTAACLSGGRDRPGSGSPAVTDPAPTVAGTMRPYQIRGQWHRPEEDRDYDQRGEASWYGDAHHGRRTASGEVFDMNALSAAHRTLPLPSLVEVTNIDTGQSVVVRVNDRGPFSHGRIIDLSRAAAEAVGIRVRGVGEVRVRYVGPAPRLGSGPVQRAEATAPARDREHDRREYWVQAGAFAERDNAEHALDQLGDRASIDRQRRDGRTLYRVLVGPWPDPNRAEQARMDAVARGYADALLISGR